MAQGAAVSQTGHHERLTIGGRTTATAVARMELQPRPYMSYGLSNNTYRVDIDGGGTYKAGGMGVFVGVGVEFPMAQKTSFSLDTRYHTWGDTDSTGVAGQFTSIAISLLYVGRF